MFAYLVSGRGREANLKPQSAADIKQLFAELRSNSEAGSAAYKKLDAFPASAPITPAIKSADRQIECLFPNQGGKVIPLASVQFKFSRDKLSVDVSFKYDGYLYDGNSTTANRQSTELLKTSCINGNECHDLVDYLSPTTAALQSNMPLFFKDFMENATKDLGKDQLKNCKWRNR
jgi:hypothetical protein